jgi:hypothetical protein
MDIPTLDVSVAEARKALRAYHDAIKNRHNDEYRAVIAGYKAIVRGQRVINLVDAFKATGVDEKARPKLAIARADAQWCMYRRDSQAKPQFWSATRKERPRRVWRGRLPRNGTVTELPEGTLPVQLGPDWFAVVPLIPPQYLPPRGGLQLYHVLWEAVWEPAPPTDPFLLRHLRGHLYAVLAQWDLTPIERAVLGQRA